MKLSGSPRIVPGQAALVLALALMSGSAALASDALQAAQAYARQGQWAPALERVDQFLSARPRDANARLLKGVILAELNRQNDALAVFGKLAEDFPELPEPHNNMAVIYAQQKQFDKARASLAAALKTNPSYATAQENLGDVYARLASQAYDKALQTDSSNAPPPKLTMLRAVAAPPRAEVLAAAARPPAPAPAPAVPPVPARAAATSAPQLAPPPAPLSPPAPTVKPASATVKAEAQAGNKPDKTDKADAGDNQNAARQEVARTVVSWAAAWSRKDVKAYLGHYARDFSPPGRQSRAAWEAERTARVGKPGRIEVKVDNLRVALDGDTATAYFRQHYNSANLDSSGSKVLVLVKRDGRWLIRQERVGRQ